MYICNADAHIRNNNRIAFDMTRTNTVDHDDTTRSQLQNA